MAFINQDLQIQFFRMGVVQYRQNWGGIEKVTSLGSHDPDAEMRKVIFDHVRNLGSLHGHITQALLAPGINFRGECIPLVNPQRGIFKPRQMRYLLSIRTVFPKPGGKVWYDDQREVHRQLYEGDDLIDYAFMGNNPSAPENQWLREAYEKQIPVIYFLRVSPGRYEAILPVFIADWNPKALAASVSFGVFDQGEPVHLQTSIERRYALRSVKQRLHQASFRDAVITAYNGRCALSGLPEPLLLDAAHIIADKEKEFGHAVVSNGIPLSKIHHAAFDAHLIGIDPDYTLHLSDRLLSQNDGPMLAALQQLHGKLVHLPDRLKDYPDPDRLAIRFEQFKAAC